jgi:hypothetical protein
LRCFHTLSAKGPEQTRRFISKKTVRRNFFTLRQNLFLRKMEAPAQDDSNPIRHISDRNVWDLFVEVNKLKVEVECSDQNTLDLMAEVNKLKGEVVALKYAVGILEEKTHESGGQHYDRVCRGK